MRKVISVVGARPNFIKLAAISPLLKKHFTHIIVHTGQHYDYQLSQNFFDELLIPKPKYNLAVESRARRDQIQKIKKGCEKIFKKEKPDLVLIYGDVNSSLGGAKAAFATKIPIAHIEAGVRSFDKTMPEEKNRRAIDKISDILFCPTVISMMNLKGEGIIRNVHLVGDIMYEVLLKTKLDSLILTQLTIKPNEYYFATIHRQKNTINKKRLQTLFKAFSKLGEIVIFPLHPRTEKVLSKMKNHYENIKLIEPVNFRNSIVLQKNSKMILTDSGGIQKESYYLKIPCLTLRNTTEWPETVESGWNKLVDNNENKIIKFSKKFALPQKHPDFFGKGDTSFKMINIIREFLS